VFDANGKHYLKKNPKNYCGVEGQWTKYLNFENEKYWENGDYPLARFYREDYILPSDSTFREDLNYFIQNDEEQAQIWKEKMEEIQRNDRKLREKYTNNGK
jgi:hypothetical protein